MIDNSKNVDTIAIHSCFCNTYRYVICSPVSKPMCGKLVTIWSVQMSQEIKHTMSCQWSNMIYQTNVVSHGINYNHNQRNQNLEYMSIS